MADDGDRGAPAVGGPARRAPLSNRVVLALLRSPLHRLVGTGLLALRYLTGDGRLVTLPVSYVRSGSNFVVVVGASAGKRWWRHFRSSASVEVWRQGGWQSTTARVITVDSTEYLEAVSAYRHGRTGGATAGHEPVVLIAVPTADRKATEPTAPAAQTAQQLWRSWTGWVTAGEFVGFSVPAVAGALSANSPAAVTAALLVAAGAIEGVALGYAQGHVLRRVLPDLNVRRWIVATACGAALAWAIGLLPMLTDGHLFDLPLGVLIPTAALLGTVLLGSIGTAQWLVLRVSAHRSWRWILTTAGAWTAGLVVFTVVTTPLWQPGQSVLLIAAIGVLGGLLMAATVAALTGWAVIRLFWRAATPAVSPHTASAATTSAHHRDGWPGR